MTLPYTKSEKIALGKNVKAICKISYCHNCILKKLFKTPMPSAYCVRYGKEYKDYIKERSDKE